MKKPKPVNTFTEWEYYPPTGVVSGPLRTHDGNEHRTKSHRVAKLGCSEHDTYRDYPRTIADQHGQAIAALPAFVAFALEVSRDDRKFNRYLRQLARQALKKAGIGCPIPS